MKGRFTLTAMVCLSLLNAGVLAASGDNFYRHGFFQPGRNPGRLPPGHVLRQFCGRG